MLPHESTSLGDIQTAKDFVVTLNYTEIAISANTTFSSNWRTTTKAHQTGPRRAHWAHRAHFSVRAPPQATAQPAWARRGPPRCRQRRPAAAIHRSTQDHGSRTEAETNREGARIALRSSGELLPGTTRAPGTPPAPLPPSPPHPTASTATRGPTARLHGRKRAQRSGVEYY